MGKKQHQKDKLWLTATEWKTIYGGKKLNKKGQNMSRMPYNYCNLKYVIATNPCCTKEGIVFDYQNILEFIKKHKLNPLTNKKLKVKDLLKIKFYENVDGSIHCPITYKVFNDNSKIVVSPNSGNVFSYEGLSLSNLKGDQWRDPFTDEYFNKSDLIVIQDPEYPNRFNMNAFYTTDVKEETKGSTLNAQTNLNYDILQEVREMEKKHKLAKKEKIKEEKVLKDKINESIFSTGQASSSLTSTVAPVVYINESGVMADDKVRYQRIKESGFVSIITNFGKINLELFCQTCPKTCENFIKLCKKKYYDNTKFHRLIKHFVLQGGDPTGTGKGGKSIWGKPFEDEISKKYSHNSRGFLCMANSGPNTNQSQFFILLRPALHLDKKHTIFGKIVGGMKVLDEIELIPTDNKDVPIEAIEIICTDVFVDPFDKVDEEIKLEREKIKEDPVDESLLPRNRREEDDLKKKSIKGTLEDYQSKSSLVGKYLSTLMPPPGQNDDTTSGTTKRKLIGQQDDDIISEYELKQIKRKKEVASSSQHIF